MTTRRRTLLLWLAATAMSGLLAAQIAGPPGAPGKAERERAEAKPATGTAEKP